MDAMQHGDDNAATTGNLSISAADNTGKTKLTNCKLQDLFLCYIYNNNNYRNN